MSLELIKKFLKDNGKDNPELSINHIDDAIETVKRAESERFKEEARKIRTDIDKLKPFKKALEDVGFDGTSELPDFIDSLKKVREEEKNKPAKTELEKQIAALASQVKTLTDANKLSTEEKLSLQKERKVAVLKEKLMKDLGEKLAGGEAHVKTLIYENRVDLDEDGKTPVFKDSGISVSYEDGIKKFLKDHETDLKDTQRSGVGSKPGSDKSVIARPDMPLTDMLKLPR